jgi:hypothetical protein
MSIAALITWIVTAGFGFFMLIRWATRGGVRKVDGAGTHLPPVRVFTHFGLAAAGLIIWIIYLVTDSTILAWIAVVDLVIIAIIGVVMVRQWAKDGRAAMAASAAGAGGANAGALGAQGDQDCRSAEQHPRPRRTTWHLRCQHLDSGAADGTGPRTRQ